MLKIGHRGAAGHAPENTIKSFEKALELGVDAIEFDVRAISDGTPVVFHNSELLRPPDQLKYPVKIVTQWGLEALRIGGEPVPTLLEVLEKFGKRTILNIELKVEGIADQVLKMIREHGLVNSVIVSAFDDSDNSEGDSSNWVDLLWMQRQEPKLKIALLAEKESTVWRACRVSEAYHIYAIAISKYLLPSYFRMDEPKASPVPRIFVWTVNDVAEMRTLKEEGVDGIFSDYPDRFKEAGIE